MADNDQRPVSNPPIPPLAGGPKTPKKEDKGGAAALPMWSSKGGDKLAGMPMFRGAALKPNSLLGRMKNLKTKDLAFIGAGLAVLVMAPLAEYLISESGDSNSPMTQGFDHKGSMFPSGSDPSEMGNMLARGGLIGESPDVITPLNARDPSSLIMAAGGGEKETPAVVTPPIEVKRDAPKDSVWDKVVSSAKSGASSAARKVGLPKPNVKLAGALNGLRSLSGGSTGAKLALEKPSSAGLVGRPRADGHMAPTQAAPGYRGAGSRSLASASGGGGFDGRRGGGISGGAGGSAGDVMGGGVNGGGTGTHGGRPNEGGETKNPGGSSTKDNKALGENLEFLRRRMEMEKALDLKWSKKKYDELERKKMIEQTLVQTAQQAFLKVLDKLLEGKKDGGGGSGGGGSGGGGSPPGGKDPAKDPANRDAALPDGGVARPTQPPPAGETPVGQSDAAIPSAQELGTANKALGTQVSHLGSLKGTLDTYVGAIDPNDQYGKQIHPPAASAQKKVSDAAAAYEDVKGQLASAKGQIDSSNEKIGAANTKIEAKLQDYQQFGTSLGQVVKGFGELKAPPQASVEPGAMDGPAGKVAAHKPLTEEFQSVDTFLQEAKDKQTAASETAGKAPRDVSAEVGQVQQVVAANPNCAGCGKALDILKDAQQSLTNTGQAATTASKSAGYSIERSNAAGQASRSLDSQLDRGPGKRLVEDGKTATATDYKKMQDLEKAYTEAKQKYEAGDTAAKTAMDQAITDADAIRTGAQPREQKITQFTERKKQSLAEAKKKLGS